MGTGSRRNSACALGDGGYFALVAQKQEKLASVWSCSSLSLGVLRRHALSIQGLGGTDKSLFCLNSPTLQHRENVV
jgi:hypothetical protein